MAKFCKNHLISFKLNRFIYRASSSSELLTECKGPAPPPLLHLLLLAAPIIMREKVERGKVGGYVRTYILCSQYYTVCMQVGHDHAKTTIAKYASHRTVASKEQSLLYDIYIYVVCVSTEYIRTRKD